MWTVPSDKMFLLKTIKYVYGPKLHEVIAYDKFFIAHPICLNLSLILFSRSKIH